MAQLPKTGVQTLGILGAVTVVSLGLQAVGNRQISEPPLPKPPAKIGKWKAEPGRPVLLNAERDSPPAVYYVYTANDQPSVYVSIARVTTLNTFRGPFSYLFDKDGRVKGNQKVLVPRTGQETPLRMLALGAGREEMAMMQHWVQPWGADPIPEPTDTPGQVMATTFLHQPAFVCDVWIPVRGNSNYQVMETALSTVADAIDAQIKARRAQ